MKINKILTIVLCVIIGIGACSGGIYTAYKFTVQFDEDVSPSVFTEIEPVVPNSKYNVLLMGTDAEGALTDVMMVYQIDPNQGKVNVLSIPRDTRILFNGRSEKINAAHAHGKNKSDGNGGNRADEYAIRAIKELTGIPIHHYACINTAAFRQIIDAIDGFDFDVPMDMNYDDDWQDLHIHLKEGMQHMDGDKAEQLVRFRNYPNGDVDRIAVQQSALKELIKQKVNPVYFAKVPEIYSIVLSNIDTDMSVAQAWGLAKNILDANGNEEGIATYTLPGVGKYVGKTSYFIADIDATEKLVAETFGYGEAAMVDGRVGTE